MTAAQTIAPAIARRPRRQSSISLKYLWCELRRPFRRSTLIFNLALPVVLYLALFRTNHSANLPGGNFAMWMMIGIAVYGAATSATSYAASISVDEANGWTRTIRLTPLSSVGYVLIKVLCAMVMALAPTLLIGILGMLTGAHGTLRAWVVGLTAAWLSSAIFSAFGLAIGLSLRPDVVMHIPGLVITGLAFLGNVFIPLSGTMLTIGRWSPAYGITALARYPLTNGMDIGGGHDSLSAAIIGTLCWFAGFVFWASRRFGKSTGRQ
ncbi:ABC transporter permease [Cutibacterium sp. WCA-380-WT-3A]|uniref:ABC transporter permease n=1 Tax=Cutibacterium porci TaxID=2605781 RepID=A0A7K0J3U8_9ACTN|nr:ABC transporter permease [Cutibacterium porci]MSS44605.1 ABC transporter permease [Cutibacterium porci]